MLDSYRRVLAHPGAKRFTLAGLVARLPTSMVSLGIVLLVQAQTGSYGLAGTVSAAYVLSQAVAAVVHGRLLDTLGQSRVLPVAGLAFGAFLAATMLSVERSWPLAVTYLFAALAGASIPQVGASVRTRWSHVLDNPRRVQTAFALESVLDEVVFIVGPVLATVLATAWHPVAGLSVALVSGVLGTLVLAAQRSTEPPAHRRVSAGDRAPMPWLVVGPLALLFMSMGALFGAVEVTAVAFAEEQGSQGASGWLLAAWAFGSLVSGVVTGAIAWRRPPVTRLRLGIAALTASMVPLPWVEGLVPMALVLAVGGIAIAPTLIATMSVVEASVPAPRLTEGLALLHTGIVAGVAPGATVAGFVIDRSGSSPAFLVAVAAGVLGIASAQLTRLAGRRQRSVAGH